MATKTKTQPNVSLGLFATAPETVKAKSSRNQLAFIFKNRGKDLKRFYELTKTIDEAAAELKMIKAGLKGDAVDKFLELYDAQGKKPDNFLFKSNDCEEQVLFMAKDQYSDVTDEQLEELKKNCPELMEKVTNYSFDNEIFNKHTLEIASVISKAVNKMKCLNDFEKNNLIVSETFSRVKKGAIKELGKFKNKRKIFDTINPVVSFKQV